MKIRLQHRNPIPALLRNACVVDAQKTKSLCCTAAGITAPVSATAEARIPHEKLREAAYPDATLNARKCPPAQPVVGYTSTGSSLTYGKPSRNECQEVA